jgi:uncharacterized protein
MVADIVEHNKNAIMELCRKHRIRALWIFGSATTDAWNPETSDLDFLVDLGPYDDHVHRRYFGLLQDLEDLTGRPVDLLTVKSVDNPYLREELEETRKLVYGPADAEVAA